MSEGLLRGWCSLKSVLRHPLKEAQTNLVPPVTGLGWTEYFSALNSVCLDRRQDRAMLNLFRRWVEERDVGVPVWERQLAAFVYHHGHGRQKGLADHSSEQLDSFFGGFDLQDQFNC